MNIHTIDQAGASVTRPTFRASVDAVALHRLMREARVGEVITYAQMTAALRRRVDSSTPELRTAMKMCEREDRMIFGAVRNEGYRRLSDTEIVDASDGQMTRSRKMARRASARLGLVEFDRLPETHQIKHNAAMSIFGLVIASSNAGAVKKVTAAVAKSRRELPMAETIKALGIGPVAD